MYTHYRGFLTKVLKARTLDIYDFLWIAINRKKQLKSQTETSSICRQRKPGNMLENIRKYIYVRDGCNVNEIYHSNKHNFLYLNVEVCLTQSTWIHNTSINCFGTDLSSMGYMKKFKRKEPIDSNWSNYVY